MIKKINCWAKFSISKTIITNIIKILLTSFLKCMNRVLNFKQMIISYDYQTKFNQTKQILDKNKKY